jgi:hypothetical protein
MQELTKERVWLSSHKFDFFLIKKLKYWESQLYTKKTGFYFFEIFENR